VPVLGQLPLDASIREQADSGRPTVVADPDGEVAQIYRMIALRTAAQIAATSRDMSRVMPSVKVVND
jgi:ATP-binding protein involved in chromosome partitioning